MRYEYARRGRLLPDEAWTRILAEVAVEAVTPVILAEAGKVITEEQAREIMQQQVEAAKPALLAEVAAVTDERVEQLMERVRRETLLAFAAQLNRAQGDVPAGPARAVLDHVVQMARTAAERQP
jgi:hypothetical protein